MRLSFHPEAREEFRLAIDYYEERETTLGYQFAAEVYAAIERTSAHPEMWPFIEEGVRRVPCPPVSVWGDLPLRRKQQ